MAPPSVPSNYLDLTDKIVKVLEQFQTIITMVKDSTNDIDNLQEKSSETDKRTATIFRIVYEGSDSLVSQVFAMKQASDKLESTVSKHLILSSEFEEKTKPLMAWYGENKDEIKELIQSLEWISNQRERERKGITEPWAKRISTVVAIMGGIAGIVALLLSNLNH